MGMRVTRFELVCLALRHKNLNLADSAMLSYTLLLFNAFGRFVVANKPIRRRHDSNVQGAQLPSVFKTGYQPASHCGNVVYMEPEGGVAPPTFQLQAERTADMCFTGSRPQQDSNLWCPLGTHSLSKRAASTTRACGHVIKNQYKTLSQRQRCKMR